MIVHANQKEEDAAREEWFATIDVRRREREAKEAKKKEQEKFVVHPRLGSGLINSSADSTGNGGIFQRSKAERRIRRNHDLKTIFSI